MKINTTIKQKHQGEQDTDRRERERRGLKIKQISMLQGMDSVFQWQQEKLLQSSGG